MKLRIRGNSVRLRLKRGEVDQIAAGTSVVEKTHFPGAILTFRLEASDGNSISANFDNGNLVVSLPRKRISEWASSSEVSLSEEQKLPDADSLSLLIEKDFSCLEPGHHRDCDDDADTFPHPSAEERNT